MHSQCNVKNLKPIFFYKLPPTTLDRSICTIIVPTGNFLLSYQTLIDTDVYNAKCCMQSRGCFLHANLQRSDAANRTSGKASGTKDLAPTIRDMFLKVTE